VLIELAADSASSLAFWDVNKTSTTFFSPNLAAHRKQYFQLCYYHLDQELADVRYIDRNIYRNAERREERSDDFGFGIENAVRRARAPVEGKVGQASSVQGLHYQAHHRGGMSLPSSVLTSS